MASNITINKNSSKKRKLSELEGFSIDRTYYNEVTRRLKNTDFNETVNLINSGKYIDSDTLKKHKDRLKQYKNDFDFYNQTQKLMSKDYDESSHLETTKFINQLSSAITKAESIYSNFDNEHEYNDAVKVGELYDMSSADILPYLDTSKTKKEKNALVSRQEELEKQLSKLGASGNKGVGAQKKLSLTKELNDVKKQIRNLEESPIAYTTSSGQNITWQSLYDKKKAEEDFNKFYGEISSTEDWHESIKKGAEYQNPSKDKAEAKVIVFGKEMGGTKSPINKVSYFEKYGKEIAFGEANGGGSSVVHSRIGEMTKQEKEIYNYYFGRGEYDKAEEYLNSLESTLQDRLESQQTEYIVRLAEKHPIIASGLSVGLSIGSGAEAIKDGIKYLGTGELDTNHGAELSSAIRGTVSSKVDWEVGDWDAFDFLYGTGMSMADSVVSQALFGKFGGIALGLSAAAQGTNDALNRGMSKGQAFMSGVASGIFEGVFETWSIGAFGGLTKNLKRADFRNLAKYVGKNMWNNAKEETLTEIANIIYDTTMNGDFSQTETAIRQYMASGMSESDAKKKVAAELGIQVVEAAGSGALMGFGFGAGGSVSAAHNISQSGRAIKDSGQTRNLVNVGKSFGEGTEAYEYANKITDKSRGLAIGNLLGAVADGIPNTNKMDMIKAFEERGYNTREANLLVNKMFEQGLDSVSNIQGMVSPAQTYTDVLNDPNSTVSQRNEAYEGILRGVAENRLQKAMGKAVKNKSATASHKALTEEQGKLSAQDENPVESKFESNTEGKDFDTKSGRIIESKKLVSSEKDNMAFEVTYDDDTTETVDANDINFGNDGEALVYSTVMDMNVPVGVAETLINGYKGNDVKSAATYVNGMREAFTFGKYNQEADLNNGQYASQLTDEQRSNAFKLGQIYAKEKADADEKAIKGETKPKNIKKQEGKVHFEGDKLSLKSVQDVSLESLDVLGKALGKDIHIFESYVDKNGKRVYKDANGNIKKAPNGFYNQADGSIWIDLNAGNSGQGTMLYTVAHELTHFIKQWSPTKFKALADFLVEQYGKEGVSVHQLVLAQQKKAKDNGREISYDVAFEEMVADSMEAMLTDGKVIRELAHKDKGLFNKIKSWIDNLLRKLNKEYKNYSPESNEGQMLREMKKTFEEAQRLFADALVDASDNFSNSSVRAEKNTTTEGDVKLSDKDYGYWLNKIETISDEDALKTRSEITYLNVADSTPNILQKYGALNLPLVIRFDAMYLAQRGSGAFEGHYHHLGKNVMGNLLDYVSNPDAILKTITTNKKGEDVTKLVALVSIPIKSGEALASIEINTVKDIGKGDELYNLIVTFFDYKENYLRNLFVKYGAETKYKKETLSQDNPKLHKWLGTIEESVSKNSIPQASKKSQEKLSDRDEMQERYNNLQKEYTQLEKEAEALKTSKEYLDFLDSIAHLQGEELDNAIRDYGEWTHKSGLYAKSKRMSEIIGEQKDISATLDNERELSRDAYMKSVENLTEKEKMDFVDRAVKRYGTTNRVSLASYLMLNGKMLDFSDGQGYRVQDHREISEILDMPDTTGYSDGLIAFMNMGNIRMQTYGIDISQTPNQAQKSALRDIISQIMRNENEFTVDFSKTSGYTDGSVTYPKGTATSKILADIDSYFETGVVPEYNSSIAEFRYSDRDSEGNTLSKEQIEFFKDSKVRDEEGNLLVVYHGTRNTDFTVFKRNATYFTDNKSMADSYSPNGAMFEGYVNITKPYEIDAIGEKWSAIPIDEETKQFLQDYGASVFKEKGKWRTTPADIASAIEEAVDNGELDYDGIIIKNVDDTGGYYKGEAKHLGTDYIVFNSNQFKNVDNKNPTTDPDIRYSDRVLMGSLFSGGGTLEAGLVYQMLDKEFAVEYNKQIASTYTDNHGKEHMFVGDIRDFNSKDKRNVFYLHASPVCKNFSSASHSGGETTLDITTAQATARVLEEQMPQVFTVENVKRYIGSEAYNIITNKLDELGYIWDVDVYKASDYGNATKRERMIIRAVKSGELPAKPQKVSNITSWGEATRDLWETDLTPSYLVRSKIEAIKNTPSLKGIKLTKLDRPLMIYDTTKSKTINYAWADELAPTLTTKCGDARIIMPDGRVYAPTPKFMGRIQGLPDDYKYPKSTTRAFTIIGNGIPTQLTKAVMGGVLDSAYKQTHDGEVLYSDRDEAPIFYSQMGKVVEGVKQEKLAANSVVNLLRGKGVKAEEIRWSGIVPFLEGKKSVTKQELLDFINKSMLQIGEQMSSNDIDLRYDSSNHTYNLYDKDGNVINTYTYNEFMGGYVSENDDEIYTHSTDIEDAVREEYGSMSSPRWADYKLGGGSNYRELVFTLPNNSYSNQMMRVHWGEDAEGVLVHARIQDFEVNGKKMLFIEEIQSDWHNEGHKNGYESSIDVSKSNSEVRFVNGFYELFLNGEDTHTGFSESYIKSQGIAKSQIHEELIKDHKHSLEMSSAMRGKHLVPDAPFKENYHEYVLKRLLRMAAEQGYDSIGWTTAQTQDERWNDHQAHEEGKGVSGNLVGYTIEYDQEMPKFLKKYGRQWGAKVEKAFAPNSNGANEYAAKRISVLEEDIKSYQDELKTLDEDSEYAQFIREGILDLKESIKSLKEKAKGIEIWSMDITDSMKNSVLYEGQVLYSERDTDSLSTRSLLANALEGAAQNDIEKNKLAQYKEKIALIESEQKKLHELREKLFTKGIKGDERRKIQEEATQTANRINTYDRQLFNLESTTALKNVLTREKELARKRQKQKDNENLRAYKEKVAKTTRELLKKNRESRERAIEGRTKTEMRHKVKKVVNDLNNLLLKPTKERHVPEEMRIAVAEALALVNMDTVDADTRVARLNEKIAKTNDPDIIASLTESRDRILNQGNKLGEKLTKLKDAYGMIRDSADDSLKSMYDDVIYSKIESVQKKVGKTPLRSMTLEQLESVYELYKMVLTTVRDSNKAFAEDLKMTRQALGSNTFAEIKDNNKARDRIRFEGIENFGWKYLKPMMAMKTIGSGILQKLWNNILYGQEVFAQDYDEAVKFAKEMKEKYGYKKWNLNKLYSFESKSGKLMKINLEQMMSIYAYSKRKQADEHIEFGGVLLNESIIKEKKLGRTVEVKVNDSTAYRLDKLQVGEIIDTLEKEFPGAKDFVDEMQKYLSETMGEKGNEVSMKMYGIKLFKEEHYFPLKSSKDFMEAANAKLKGDVKIKNKGMTKSTVEHANNPIVLEGFLDVWGNHVNEMAMYHGLVLPLEDFSRTLNYGFKADDNLNADAESVRTALRSAFGESADNYLNELLKAINGGVLHDSSSEIADKMISKFKKAKVMASLSVIIQQPTAIIRAMGIIEPKYFTSQNFHHKQTWEELKKYCPTAIIKETGSFDTNMGRTIVDMVKEDRKFTEKVGDALGKAPAWMDEMGWNMIWRALKKKVATEQNLSGEALLKECGRQMTLIINETQVYDSVMSRNELMRSKSALTKMATAFMGEPTTVANMIYGAVLDFKRGNKGIASKTVAAVVSSVVINGLVSSLVYAFRDDDEEKTWLEKYLTSATTEVIDGLNPLTYIPFVKDAYSIFQGYDVERTDMSLIGDVYDALEDFYNVLDPEAYEDMSSEEIAKHIYENSIPLLTSICDMFGLPVGNILRDAEAIIINDNLSMSKTSSEGLGLAVKEGWTNSSPKIVQKFVDDEKYHKLYLIANNGDAVYVKSEVAEMVAEKVASGNTEKEAKQSVKSSFTSVYREEYKKAYKNRDAEEMNRIRKFLYATGLWNSLSELDSLLAKWREDA